MKIEARLASDFMQDKVAVIVTSIARPNRVLRELARGCTRGGHQFIVIGDEASPPVFDLEGSSFYSLEEQRALDLRLARLCPVRHYARKNIGYLIAAQGEASVIIETDDDNIPHHEFWSPRRRRQKTSAVSENSGWVNVYSYFTEALIWPRGLPLDEVRAPIPSFESLAREEVDCPIQQGLANEDPDVDAVYRLLFDLPQSFRNDRRVALKSGSWCPFNSQNTTWWRDAFPLMYLPAHCSFRMTDIWRSFIAQRIAWANGWSVLFHEPTVSQERNQHNLMRDFKDEVPGYLENHAIRAALENLQLKAGARWIGENLLICYEKLVRMKIFGEQELELVEAWLEDLKSA